MWVYVFPMWSSRTLQEPDELERGGNHWQTIYHSEISPFQRTTAEDVVAFRRGSNLFAWTGRKSDKFISSANFRPGTAKSRVPTIFWSDRTFKLLQTWRALSFNFGAPSRDKLLTISGNTNNIAGTSKLFQTRSPKFCVTHVDSYTAVKRIKLAGDGLEESPIPVSVVPPHLGLEGPGNEVGQCGQHRWFPVLVHRGSRGQQQWADVNMAEGPCSLYKLSVRAAGKNAHRVKLAFRLLPVALQSDVYCQVSAQFSKETNCYGNS